MYILLLGPPGAGKGTQGAILANKLGLSKASTGELLRDAVAQGTELGHAAKIAAEAGQLVSDDLILKLIREVLERPGVAQGAILDGAVRTVSQAEGLSNLLADRGQALDHVLFLDVSEEELLPRLERRRNLEGRADDEPTAAVARLKAYREQTAPVIAWYEVKGLLRRVAGEGSIQEVALRVCAAIAKSPARQGGERGNDVSGGHN